VARQTQTKYGISKTAEDLLFFQSISISSRLTEFNIHISITDAKIKFQEKNNTDQNIFNKPLIINKKTTSLKNKLFLFVLGSLENNNIDIADKIKIIVQTIPINEPLGAIPGLFKVSYQSIPPPVK